MINPRYDVYRFTGAVAIAETIVPSGGEFRLAGFTIHGDATFAATPLTFTLDSRDGSAYDVVLLSQTLTAAADDKYMIPEDERVPLKPGDEIDIAYANGNSVTYGLTVLIERE
jgi:hypothetical protein